MRLWGNEYNKMEFAGAFGDLGTFIPFVVGYITLNKMDPLGILVAFGLFKIFVGLYFRTPVPIQPMKAIGGMAGHIRFGARTGGALVMLGILVLLTGLFLSDSVSLLFQVFPGRSLGLFSFLTEWNWLWWFGTSSCGGRTFLSCWLRRGLRCGIWEWPTSPVCSSTMGCGGVGSDFRTILLSEYLGAPANPAKS